MTERSFHHGNLRAVLLERAELMLQAEGVHSLSLRELARQAGVSHGAPRSHFIDRQALLDALAARGFERLTDGVQAASRSAGGFEVQFREVARSYVSFAVENAALMELMFTVKATDPTGPVRAAAEQLFRVLDFALDGQRPEGSDDDAAQRLKLLFAATMQGIASLRVAHRVTDEQGDQLLEDAVDELLGSSMLARARSAEP
jgi:AcrR family transcriptional regulator